MHKKLLVAILLLGLVAALSAPAAAGKKKKVKPWKSETVTIVAGHPAFHGPSGGNLVSVTAQEFFQSCAVPTVSNGVDAYVFEVPKAYQKLMASATATGSSQNPAGYDLDLYFYDKACAATGVSNAAGTDELGIMPKGTAFILVHAYTGNPVDAQVTLKPYK
jgi:hypothetical protein